MSDNVIFAPRALKDYIAWQAENRKSLNKINDIIKDIQRNGYTGIGHPEALKDNFSGFWSREIDKKNRIVYRITESKDIEIIQCKGHYNDK